MLIGLLIVYELYEAHAAERRRRTDLAKPLILPLVAGLLLAFLFTVYLKIRQVIG